MTVDAERLLAFERLLARPDERVLCGKRRHRMTHAGKHDRRQTLWVPSVQAWTHHRIARAIGPLDGWKSAERPRRYALPFRR